MLYIIGSLACFYLLNGLYYFIGILKLLKRSQHKINISNDNTPFVTIILSARNEADSIGKCLECLVKQTYPSSRYEIIPVNDASEDQTMEIINDYMLKNDRVKPINIKPGQRQKQGKINAIDKGILNAKGEIIITTDADTWMGTEWISKMVGSFDNTTGFVLGITLDQISNNPVHAFQALDGIGILVIAAALADMHNPITCRGTNLAFRKDAYLEVRDKVLHLSSTRGNREWLMQEINNNTDWKIRSQVDPDSFVYTSSLDKWIALINQRARWASSGKNYTQLSVRLYLTLIYFSLLSFIVGPFVLGIKMSSIIWGIKLLIDLTVAVAVVKVVQQPRLLYAFPLVFFVQPVMVVITAFLGTFDFYRWK